MPGFVPAWSLKPKAPDTLVVALLGKGKATETSEPQHRLSKKGSLNLVAVSETGRALSFWPNKETPVELSPEAQIRAKQLRGLIAWPGPAPPSRLGWDEEKYALLTRKRPCGVPSISDLLVCVQTTHYGGTTCPGDRSTELLAKELRSE